MWLVCMPLSIVNGQPTKNVLAGSCWIPVAEVQNWGWTFHASCNNGSWSLTNATISTGTVVDTSGTAEEDFPMWKQQFKNTIVDSQIHPNWVGFNYKGP